MLCSFFFDWGWTTIFRSLFWSALIPFWNSFSFLFFPRSQKKKPTAFSFFHEILNRNLISLNHLSLFILNLIELLSLSLHPRNSKTFFLLFINLFFLPCFSPSYLFLNSIGFWFNEWTLLHPQTLFSSVTGFGWFSSSFLFFDSAWKTKEMKGRWMRRAYEILLEPPGWLDYDFFPSVNGLIQ